MVSSSPLYQVLHHHLQVFHKDLAMRKDRFETLHREVVDLRTERQRATEAMQKAEAERSKHIQAEAEKTTAIIAALTAEKDRLQFLVDRIPSK